MFRRYAPSRRFVMENFSSNENIPDNSRLRFVHGRTPSELLWYHCISWITINVPYLVEDIQEEDDVSTGPFKPIPLMRQFEYTRQ